MDFSSWFQSLQNIDAPNGILMLAGAVIIGLLLLYVLFASIRTFFAWLYRIDTVIRTQHDTNNILLEILDTLENINEHMQKVDTNITKNTKQIKKLNKNEGGREISIEEKKIEETLSKSENKDEENNEK